MIKSLMLPHWNLVLKWQDKQQLHVTIFKLFYFTDKAFRLWAFSFLCMYVRMWVTCAWCVWEARGQQPLVLFLRHSPPCFISCSFSRQGLSVSWSSPTGLDQLDTKPLESTCLCHPNAEITRPATSSSFLKTWFLGVGLKFLCLHGKYFTNWV